MIKLKSYLRPFVMSLLLAVVLLFAQALCDLNLPNFMSKIVNVGIQQNGIEHSVPEAVSIRGMNLITAFMQDDEKALIEHNYNLVSVYEKNEKGRTYLDIYPKAKEKIYVKKPVTKQDNEELNDVFSLAVGTFMHLIKDLEKDPSALVNENSLRSIANTDLNKIYETFPLIDSLTKQQIMSYREHALKEDKALLNKTSVFIIKAFYSELGVDLSGIQNTYIIRVGSLMLFITLLGGIATVFVSLISSRISSGIARNMRRDVFTKIENLSINAFEKFSTASLITRCTNDITQIQMLLMIGIRMICYAPIMATGGIIMAIKKSASMSWIIAIAVIALVGLIIVAMSMAMPKFKIMQRLVDRLNLVSRENLSGTMVIRAFSTQKHEKNRFESANKDITDTSVYIGRTMVFLMTGITLIMNGISLIIVWSGAHVIAASSMQVGDMIAFMQYAMQVIMSFMMISMMFIFIPRAAVSADRISQVLSVEDCIKDPVNPETFDDDEKKGIVQFNHVYFRYDNANEDALRDITFTAKPGQTTAIIGSTGSGKTTIVNLMLRFYDVGAGQILINGKDIRDVSQKDLRSHIGYVPQKAVLLSGTISSNLKYGKKHASDEEIQTAAKIAQASEFIYQKSDGFDSTITQAGSNISGGQKQRLSIARALVTKPDIYIFDDSFSALDFKTDSALRKALKEYTNSSTVILIGQRVSTIKNAEQIIVLNEGGIAGIGTHKELLKTCKEYYEIASSQLTQEELL